MARENTNGEKKNKGQDLVCGSIVRSKSIDSFIYVHFEW